MRLNTTDLDAMLYLFEHEGLFAGTVTVFIIGLLLWRFYLTRRRWKRSAETADHK
jgi:hypothetical protein